MFHYVGSNICNLQTKVSLRDDYAMSSPLIWHKTFAKCVDKVIDSTVIWTRNVDCRDVGGTVHDMDLSGNLIEVLYTPAGEPEMLLAMVHEINETEVAPEERLTDSIYPMRLADGEYRLSGIRPR